MIKNNRLDALVAKTNGINTLLDIGTDHGLVIYKALKLDYIKNAIANDINVKPLNMARKTLKDYDIEYVLGNGFKNVNSKFDGVMIAGMGGNLISEILLDAPSDNNIKYILQANNKYERLRTFLVNNNYKIIDEELVYDNHYYVIMTVIRGKQVLSEEEIYLGPFLMKKKSSIEYYQHVLNHYKQLYEKHDVDNFRFDNYIKMLSDIIDKNGN